MNSVPPNAPDRAGAPHALLFIFITVLLDTMALGMVMPVLPSLITQLLVGHPISPGLAERLHRLPGGTVSLAAVIFGLFNTVFALMQFFFSPVIGSLSDRFGRRPLILASNLGLGLNYALMVWAPNLAWLFLGRVLSGVTGASIGTASAYVADVTPPERRSQAFGRIYAAFGAGLMLGPALGGVLGEYSTRAPFLVAAALSLANAVYGLLALPESLPADERHGFSWRNANPVGALGLLRRHPELFGLASVAFLSNLAQVSLGSVVVLYVTHRYGWTSSAVGAAMAAVGVAIGFVQVVVVGRAAQRFGARITLVFGLGCGALGLAVAGLAPSADLFLLAIPPLALWGMSGAAVQSLMTHRVSKAEQGQLQGANASLTGISEFVGPSVFSLTFAYFVSPGHPMAEAGAPFLLAAAVLSGAAAWGWVCTRGEVGDEREADATPRP